MVFCKHLWSLKTMWTISIYCWLVTNVPYDCKFEGHDWLFWITAFWSNRFFFSIMIYSKQKLLAACCYQPWYGSWAHEAKSNALKYNCFISHTIKSSIVHRRKYAYFVDMCILGLAPLYHTKKWFHYIFFAFTVWPIFIVSPVARRRVGGVFVLFFCRQPQYSKLFCARKHICRSCNGNQPLLPEVGQGLIVSSGQHEAPLLGTLLK